MLVNRIRLSFIVLLVLAISGGGAFAQTDTAIPPLVVAALGENSSTWSLVLLDFNAGGPQRLTDDTFDDVAPLVSADGRYIVFLRGHFANEISLTYHLLDRECLPECEPVPLPDQANDIRDLRWSPVSAHLIGWGPENALWLIDIEANSIEQVIGGKWNANPAWSPDGTQIVVSSDVLLPGQEVLSDDIQVIPNGLELLPEARTSLTYTGEFVEDVRPLWSPDGLHIAYLTRVLTPEPDYEFAAAPFGLFVLDALCIDDASSCPQTRRLLSQEDQVVTQFAWAPDSRSIVYKLSASFTAANDPGELWIVDVETGTAQALVSEPTAGQFTWAPDSRAVVYENLTESSFDVFLAFVDGSSEPGPVLRGFRASATPYWAVLP